ncbi:MAG: DUF4349 domain-containing protein [Treponemataceae bacterium]
MQSIARIFKTVLPPVLIAGCLFFSCSANMNKEAADFSVNRAEASSQAAEVGVSDFSDTVVSVQNTERKIIKNGSISFETNDIAEATRLIQNILTQVSGYIADENTSSYNDTERKHITVRIPAEKFDTFVAALSNWVGTFKTQNFYTEDVTTTYIDYEARLRVKKETEQRYLALFNRANSVTEVIEVERELQNLRAEIESLEGQLRYLSSQVNFSTLELSISSPHRSGFTFFTDMGTALTNGGKYAYHFFIGLLSIWPFILLTVGIVLFWVRFSKRKKRECRAEKTE